MGPVTHTLGKKRKREEEQREECSGQPRRARRRRVHEWKMRGGNRCKESAVELSIEEEIGEMTWWKESGGLASLTDF